MILDLSGKAMKGVKDANLVLVCKCVCICDDRKMLVWQRLLCRIMAIVNLHYLLMGKSYTWEDLKYITKQTMLCSKSRRYVENNQIKERVISTRLVWQWRVWHGICKRLHNNRCHCCCCSKTLHTRLTPVQM